VETQLDYSDSFDSFDRFVDSSDVKDRARHKLKNVKRKSGAEHDVKRNTKPQRGVKISHYFDY
jgi:hypothetical protein